MTHLHLDTLGGIAGDMVVASLLHLAPDEAEHVRRNVRLAAGCDATPVPHEDGVLAGRRFRVTAPETDRTDGHDHVDWRRLRTRLAGCGLPAPVAARSAAIFTVLADAEARVHGTTPDEVTFHEVGAHDSVADIVAAATLLEQLDVRTASVSALPLGGGRVETAHGPLPIPAPATALILEGFRWHDDGIGGERVTPTGAAIVRHLVREPDAPRPIGRLRATGVGFGTRRLDGISNCVRALLIDVAPGAEAVDAVPHRRLAVVTCEIDDQTPEDLATGLDRMRALPFVHDALTVAAIGKKGRMTLQLQLLADAGAVEDAIGAVFRETTTIGLRIHQVDGRALRRRVVSTTSGPRVKRVERPGGPTGKPEADDVATAGDAAARARLAARAIAESDRAETDA